MKDSDESNKNISIDKLINQPSDNTESAGRITINKLTNQSAFEVYNFNNLQTLSMPDATRIKTLSYEQVLMKDNKKSNR